MVFYTLILEFYLKNEQKKKGRRYLSEEKKQKKNKIVLPEWYLQKKKW